MKKLIVLSTILVSTVGAWAQTPQNLSYQAVMRNSSNQLNSSSANTIQLSMAQGTKFCNTLWR